VLINSASPAHCISCALWARRREAAPKKACYVNMLVYIIASLPQNLLAFPLVKMEGPCSMTGGRYNSAVRQIKKKPAKKLSQVSAATRRMPQLTADSASPFPWPYANIRRAEMKVCAWNIFSRAWTKTNELFSRITASVQGQPS